MRILCNIVLALLSWSAFAQAPTATLSGKVTDQTGAVIPQATVTLSTASGTRATATTDQLGGYQIQSLPAGSYNVSATAKGFANFSRSNVALGPGQSQTLDVTLQVKAQEEKVNVNGEEGQPQLDVSSDSNAGALIIKGKDLEALSDDPDELQSELQALAGPSAGPNGGQIYIDGFTGGQLPPKSAIREIRINQNPFSAQYDKLGYGRIEILTKPGTDKLHGNLMIMGNDSAFNSLNPFVSEEPSYYTTFMNGSIGGALGKKASWFGSVFNRNNASNSIINAEVLDANSNVTNYTAAVANPDTTRKPPNRSLMFPSSTARPTLFARGGCRAQRGCTRACFDS